MPDLVETPDNEPAMQAAQILNRHMEKTSAKDKALEATTPEVSNASNAVCGVYTFSLIVWNVGLNVP